MTDDERRIDYLAEQERRRLAQRARLLLLKAGSIPFVSLVTRYQPIRDYQQEQRRHEREDLPKDNGITVN